MVEASITQHRAAALFFDFTAAFPSVSHQFLWVALRAAGIPEHIICAIRNLYANNHHWVRIKGGTFRSVTVLSGVKQGCPLSPTLFILAGEAILRCLRLHVGCGDHISGYADDTAVVLRELLTTAPALACAFRRIAGVTGLELNPRKCIMVPLWSRPGGRLRAFEELVPGWRAFQVATSAKYLGIYIGPDAHQHRWAAARQKFDERISTIVSIAGGALFSSIFFRVYAASVFSYIMQFSTSPGWGDTQEKACHAMFKGPFGWMPKGWFTARLPGCMLPSVFTDLEDLHAATLMRTARVTFPGATALHGDLLHKLESDEAPLAHVWRSWQRSSIAATLAVAALRADDLLRRVPLPPEKTLQAHLHSILERHRVLIPSPEVMWNRRLARWSALTDLPLSTDALRGRAQRVLKSIECTPPSTRWAVVRLWLNGWCTARRFQRREPCAFCGQMEDSVEHFARCPIIREVANERLSLGLAADDPLRFLLLDGVERATVAWCRHAAYIHAVFATHNASRHGKLTGRVQDRLWAEVRGLCMQHSSLIRTCGL